jgi:serine/threonine-protein kinase
MKLWHTGYSWRDVLNRPAAPDAFEASLATRRNLGPAQADEFGRHADTVQMARNDREAILKIMERVPLSERKLLPDVVQTIDALLKRAEELARMLHGMSADVDEGALGRIESRIEAVRQHEEGSERDRQIDLLERQRQTLSDLLARRRRVEEQIESCVLAMQNVRFDLLRLRSAGVAAVLSDLTHATQQARALSRDVDHVIAAAGEIRDVLSAAPAPSSPRPPASSQSPPQGSRFPRP